MIKRHPKALKRPKQASLASLKKKAWKLLSETIRREAAQNAQIKNGSYNYAFCFTCGNGHPWKELQAAHAIGGRTGAVLLDEDIIRPGCYRCNVALRGNYQEFIPRLIREHSLDWWESKLQSSRQIKKWSRSELLEKIEGYKARLAAL